MRRAGLLVWLAHQRAAQLVRPGVTTAELNEAIRQTFAEAGAVPLFLNYPGPTPFPAETCISVNEELVHGIPGSRQLRDGDAVCVDTGCRLGGWCGDAAVTHAVGELTERNRRLLKVTHETLELAIRLMATAKKWSQVSSEMGNYVTSRGFHVVTSMVGHGIGRAMHEPPQVANYFDEDSPGDDFDLRPGLVIAVEPMVNVGTGDLECLADGWTQVSADRSFAAHFEHTLAITSAGVRRLTGPPEGAELEQLPDWLGPEETWLVW
jgi:methionyl aminopeptidase